ncbi:hypothetical protein BD309DRAFT_62210 [Dichomitus squalens]|uniref:Uncharacterized protein n=1 Tax=Dichomitus squalens TaxID=114155 RepID=A0A4Q9NVP1_9APHY|nr:hypothetical protein BD309DRAFT_62210 [Dichomitus squalens]TBU63493.1 hypothetical protein BD310DRAFT_582500 [Dichomitus squalens]
MQLGRMCRHSPSLLVPAVRLEIRDHGAMIFLLGTGGSCSDSESPSALGAVPTSVATLTSSVARMMSRTTSAGLRFSCITFTIAVSLIAANRLQISVLYDCPDGGFRSPTYSLHPSILLALFSPNVTCGVRYWDRQSRSCQGLLYTHGQHLSSLGSMNAVRAVATL